MSSSKITFWIFFTCGAVEFYFSKYEMALCSFAMAYLLKEELK